MAGKGDRAAYCQQVAGSDANETVSSVNSASPTLANATPVHSEIPGAFLYTAAQSKGTSTIYNPVMKPDLAGVVYRSPSV